MLLFKFHQDESVTSSPSCTTYSCMPAIAVTEPDVYKLLCVLDTSKSCGPDDLPPRVMKELSAEVTPILTYIFNQPLMSEQLPPDWHMANIFALHKNGALDQAENYRPISLTSVCCKILEHIVYSCICNYLDENSIITPVFRTGYSCESLLIMTLNDWAYSIDANHALMWQFLISAKLLTKCYISIFWSNCHTSELWVKNSKLKLYFSFLANQTQLVVLKDHDYLSEGSLVRDLMVDPYMTQG